jgi:phosphatidylserine/phosphatidylglycerophosphate/cardiolipin synthase-like enzyme
MLMKKVNCLMALYLSLFFINFYGMERTTEQFNAQVEVCFSPEHRYYMKHKLFALIDNAKSAIYMAIYWITDDSIIDKLIEARKRNVTVEVFFDSTTPNVTTYVSKFLANDIIPIVFPSSQQGIMHNKFVMIDFKTIFTGSANFTKAAFEFSNTNYNFENVVIIESTNIASKYLKEFVNIETTSFDMYIDMVTKYELKDLPQWLPILAPTKTNNNETIDINLIKILSAGPDVSLKGSPTVSPITADI